MPSVCPFNHPTCSEGGEACRALRTHLDLEVPRWAMLGHPRVEGVIMILLIRKDRDQTRKGGGVARARAASRRPHHHPVRRW